MLSAVSSFGGVTLSSVRSLVKFQPKRYKRPYKQYMIPRSVFQREWDKMATFNAENRKAA